MVDTVNIFIDITMVIRDIHVVIVVNYINYDNVFNAVNVVNFVDVIILINVIIFFIIVRSIVGIYKCTGKTDAPCMCEEKYLVYQIIIKFNSENENVKFQKQKD
jgi:hypothetical protein